MHARRHGLWLTLSALPLVLGARIAPALGDDSKAARYATLSV